ncbi:unnamed protein product [Prunus armeniaca]
MATSVEGGGVWTTQKDIVLCECWVKVHLERKWPWPGNGEIPWQKRGTTFEAVKILPMRSYKHKCGSVPWGKAKKSFLSHQCWEVVKNCSRFKIIFNGPLVVLNETPLHDSLATDSPLDFPMDQDTPLPRVLRPIGRKAAKAKKRSTLSNECAQFLEQIVKNGVLRIERDLKRE